MQYNADGDFDVSRLKEARIRAGMTLKEVAFKVGMSSAQVHRVEAGESQLTLDFLDGFCRAIGWHILDIIAGEERVSVIGLVGDDSVIRPVGLSERKTVRAPRLVDDLRTLRAIQFAGYGRFRLMRGHVAFFSVAQDGVPDSVWGTRSIIRLADGSMRLGWPFERNGRVHLSDYTKDVDFDVDVDWAAPLIAVISPEFIK